MAKTKQHRDFMKNGAFVEVGISDQRRGLPQPAIQKAFERTAKTLPLPKPDECPLAERDVHTILKSRRSRRQLSGGSLTLAELGYLLWATQGVDEVLEGGYATYRPVPSAGARHPFETYLSINDVGNLDPGIYRYLPLKHRLLFLFDVEDRERKVGEACLGQDFAGAAAATFFWSCVPYRGEWRYGDGAHKPMLLDAGHVCQNLYLACEALGLGTCAIAAYHQELCDDLLRLDGKDEFVVYLAPVGKAG